MNTIIFTNTMDVPKEYEPKPAFQMIPEWYKNTESYMYGEKKPTGSGDTSATIKKCMPVFDAINSGYILVTNTDFFVSQKENEKGRKEPWFEWPSLGQIEFHPEKQAPLYPNLKGSLVPKWMNPWAIKTPPGYSTLFTAPFHRDNIFTALTGVVDTDKYDAAVNIIFVLTNPDFEGLVPAGTPICQVIPFKRESWEMKIGTQEDFDNQVKTSNMLKSKFFDAYKTQYRQIKEYK